MPATMTMGPVYVSAVVSYSWAYHAADVLDNDNLVMALLAQIPKDGVLPLRKLRKLHKPQHREGFEMCSTLCYQHNSV